jgi:hypothetical protein
MVSAESKQPMISFFEGSFKSAIIKYFKELKEAATFVATATWEYNPHAKVERELLWNLYFYRIWMINFEKI